MQSMLKIGLPGQENDLTQRLRQHFDAARYGHYFRTATLVNTNTGGQEWLYAVQDPHTRRCVLMKVREQETGLVERVRVKDEVSFIDALDQMGRFEDFSLNPQYVAADAAEIKTLGNAYFNAFANREGLVRDHQSGTFQPTLQGEAVTGGLFDPEELARVLKHAKNPPKTSETFLVPGYASIAKPDQTSIDLLVSMYGTHEKIKQAAVFHSALSDLSHYNLLPPPITFYAYSHCKELYEKNYEYLGTVQELYRKQHDEDTKKPKLTKRFGDFLSAPLSANAPRDNGRRSAFLFYKILSDLRSTDFEDPAFNEKHQQMLDQQELAFEFSLAKHYSNLISSDDQEVTHTAKQEAAGYLKDRIKILDMVASRMGIDETMRSALHACVYGDAMPTCLETTKEIVKNLKDAQDRMNDEIQDYKKNLKSLAPAHPNWPR
ncbi:MAG: hypothetical protein ACXW4B_09095 [Micavibrio sp.]